MAETDFAHYYQTELAYYRALMREFAQLHPEVAYLVADRGSDEATERLLQGAALLTGRLRQRVDDDVPEIIHALFGLLWPEYLRPVPAMTLMRFGVGDSGLRQTQMIGAGVAIKSHPIDGLPCTFLTTEEVALQPVEIAAVTLNRAHPADLQLQLRLKITGGASWSKIGLDTLRLHLQGDDQVCYTLFLWLLHHAHRVTARQPGGAVLATLNDPVRPAGLGAGQEDDGPLVGLRLLQRYFGFPAALLAVDVTGLRRIPGDQVDKDLELVFHLGRPPREEIVVAANNFLLGCSPALNLSEPVQLSLPVEPNTSEYLLQPRRGQVYELSRVGGYHETTGKWHEYEPFVSLRGGASAEDPTCYQVRLRDDSVAGVQTYLAITDAAGKPRQPSTTVLQVEVTHTDAELALRLRPGDVNQSSATTPSFAVYENITPIAAPAPVRIGGNRHWQLLAQLAIHPEDLCSSTGLKQLISWARGERSVGEPVIAHVDCEVTGRLYQQTMVPMRRVTVDVADDSVSCEGQLYLLGAVLQQLLSRGLESPVLNQVTVRGTPSGITYEFEPR